MVANRHEVGGDDGDQRRWNMLALAATFTLKCAQATSLAAQSVKCECAVCTITAKAERGAAAAYAAAAMAAVGKPELLAEFGEFLRRVAERFPIPNPADPDAPGNPRILFGEGE